VNPKEGDYAMLLDSAGDYVSVPNTGSTLSAGQGDFTFSAWVDFDDASQQQMTIMSHGNPTSIGGEGFFLEYLANSSSRPLRLYWNDGAGFSQNISWLSQTQLLGGWHHIAFTYKKSGAVTLYVDGLAYRAARCCPPRI
jgi:Concanavalin A-like lectin/glucanases superfamily